MLRTKAISKVPGIVVLILFFSSVVSVSAFPGDEGGHGPWAHKGSFEGKGEMMQKIMDELDLSEEQRGKIKAFHEAQREDRQTLFKVMNEKRKALRAELEKYDHDATKVNILIDELTTSEKAMIEKRVASVVAIKQILTKEQFGELQEKMKAKRAEHKEHWGEKKGKHSHEDTTE